MLLSLEYDGVAFALLSIYRILTHRKMTKIVKVNSAWFFSHLVVLVLHLGIVAFHYGTGENNKEKPVFELEESAPSNSKPYEPPAQE